MLNPTEPFPRNDWLETPGSRHPLELYGVKKLDGIFQKIVDSHANIARAELVETSQSLTPSEMIEESEMQKEVLEKVIEPSHSDSNPPFH